ncbi:MAG: hypothetical protein HY537_06055 [Deltaproteobacteria bacterium]|nr:hypothetical protein [Deltaproteobacteria bacterium]
MKVAYLLAFLVVVLLSSCGKDVAQKDASGLSVESYSYITNSEAEDFFNKNVGPNINKFCKLCHANPAPTYTDAKKMIVAGKPQESKLYLKATGQDNHKVVWAAGTEKAENLRKWIEMEQ